MKNKTILTLILSAGVLSCNSTGYMTGKNNSGSSYDLRISSSKKNIDSAVIYGRINVVDVPNDFGIARALKVNDRVIPADSSGNFIFKLSPGKYRIDAGALMFDHIITEDFRIAAGDSVNINFRLVRAPKIMQDTSVYLYK